jgi:GNAT superfamily N-acetyltransferase
VSGPARAAAPSGPQVRIRTARRADAPVIAELLDQLGYPQGEEERTADRIQDWAEDPSSVAYVAVADGGPIGVIAVHVSPFFEQDGSWARIVALVVADRARGHGVGAQLVAAAEAFATSHGCLRVEVTSGARRPDAHGFYRRRGYVDQAGTSSRFVRHLPGSAVPTDTDG